MKIVYWVGIICLVVAKVAAANQTVYTKGFSLEDFERAKKTGEQIQLKEMPFELNRLGSSVATRQNAPMTSRIIGGVGARRGEFPEFTQLLFSDSRGFFAICGGTLIAPNKVLTAAHCVDFASRGFFVIPNFYAFNDAITSADLFLVTRINIHPDYSANLFDSDVAVLTLHRNATTPTAAVYGGGQQLIGTRGTVIGTGLTSTTPQPARPASLRKVSAPVVSNQQCNDTFQRLAGVRPVNQRMLCAGFRTDGRGSCSGDSGGPLFASIQGQRTVIGTVSFGFRFCEIQRATSVYARTGAFDQFIRAQSPDTEFIGGKAPVAIIPLLLGDD